MLNVNVSPSFSSSSFFASVNAYACLVYMSCTRFFSFQASFTSLFLCFSLSLCISLSSLTIVFLSFLLTSFSSISNSVAYLVTVSALGLYPPQCFSSTFLIQFLSSSLSSRSHSTTFFLSFLAHEMNIATSHQDVYRQFSLAGRIS